MLVHSMNNWTGIDALDQTFDRLLFVLILVEILHTVMPGVQFPAGAARIVGAR